MQQIVSFLSKPSSYNQAVDTVHVIQTHISYVFIAKPFVYKVKKPVDFGFLNFVSFDDRKFYTFEEYRLNSRISPEIYTGVVVVVKQGTSYRLIEDNNYNESDVVAYCVKMRYIDDAYSLKNLLQHGLDDRLLSLIAKKIYTFHSIADNTEGLQGFGGIAEISKNSLENFDQIEKYIDVIIPRDDYAMMRQWTEHYIEHNKNLFNERNLKGYVRDCHGDLHCEHVYSINGEIVILDCIEFNKRFRYIDTISDIAFLLMDLDVNNKTTESNKLCAQYVQLSGDYDGSVLLPFYKAYRAMVRAKINSFQSDNEEITVQERDVCIQKAKQYFHLAQSYMQHHTKPVVYIVFGNIGSGKSTIAMELASLTGGIVINSDAVRKKMAGLDVYDSAKAKAGEGIYNPDMTTKVYQTMNEKALAIVAGGTPAILDATFYSQQLRQQMHRYFTGHDIATQFVYVDCSHDELIKRIKERQQDKSISDATVDIFNQLKDRFEKPVNEVPVTIINSEKNMDEIRDQLKNIIMK
ncbi:MAG: AAA family ATPase [Spirochaetes bacterium]|nr:AAA family ATPase [Spirochaetota bacterium]